MAPFTISLLPLIFGGACLPSDFIPQDTVVVILFVLTNKSYKTYRRKFSFCGLGHAPGVGLRGAGGKSLSVEICDGAPSTACSSFICIQGHQNVIDILCTSALGVLSKIKSQSPHQIGSNRNVDKYM